ncbi:MAG TPA: TetR/AcrR family transcriptional regulator [Nocardioides sp.]|nr:TetR/AcrR family transcriptional regulator [Nocardioides sp.]
MVEQSVIERAFADALEGAEQDDPTRNRILDAAFALFCRNGIQRVSMNDVAGAAGVARVTLYRRFADRDDLVLQVVRREFRRYFDQFLLDIATARTVEERVVAGFVSSLRHVGGNELISRLMVSEPGSVISSMVSDGGGTLAAVSRFVGGQLRREQKAGNVAAGVEVELVAELMVRVTASFLLTPSRLVDVRDDRQLEELARHYLVPLLHPPAP